MFRVFRGKKMKRPLFSCVIPVKGPRTFFDEALERGKRVITTDGAPAWGEESDGVEEWVSGGVESRYGGRLLYLKGYRDGSDEERVELLKAAIEVVGDGSFSRVEGESWSSRV